MAERSERSDSRGSDKRRRGRPVDYTNHSVGRIVEDSWQQDYVIPLCSVSAKTRLSPPITYWEKSLDAEMRRGGIDSRQNSVWRNIKFTLNLRTTKVNHFRFLNLHCEPLPPLGYPPDGMSISLSLEPGREEAMLIQYGKTHGGNSVDLRLFSGGTCRTYTKNSPAGSIYRWTAILVNLRDALHQADGMMDLRLMLEKEDDMEMLRSFLAAAASDHRGVANNNRKSSEIQVPVEPQYMRLHQGSDAQLTKPIIPEHSPVIIERRPPHPQTNPNLDPRIYDPFPGIPIPLGKPGSYRATENNARRTKDTNISSESPAQTSQMLAAMELSDGGVVEGSLIGASLESQNGGNTVLTQSSSEEWSFLGKKVGGLGKVTSSLSSSSSTSSLPVRTPISSYPRRRGPTLVKTSSSSSSPPPSPSPLPSPPRRVRRGPVVVKSESESSDVEFIKASKTASVRGKKKKKKKRSESAHIESGEEKKNGVGSKKKKKKRRGKQTEVLEPVDEEETPAYIEGGDDEEMVDGVGEESFNSDVERRKRRKEVRRRRKAKEICNDKDVDNDGDVDMQGHESGISKELKKKRKKPKAIDSGLDLEPPASEVVPKKRNKSKKGKEKEIPLQSESEELSSLPVKTSKRKRDDQSAPEIEGSESLGENGGDIATWKKRLLEINLARNELFVEERELKAKLLRTQLTARKQKADEGQRFGNFTCSACGEYGHRKDSRVCEKHPGRIRR